MDKYTLTNDNIEAVAAACAVRLQMPGTTLVAPTETVYGLVCRWNDPDGVEKIYRLKERDRGKPLAMFAASLAMLNANNVVLPAQAVALAENFLPGPLTIIVSDANGRKIGVRIPDHPFIQALLRHTGFPLASTSANLSGAPNALSVSEAVKDLRGAPEIMVDGGNIPADRLASTVVDISGGETRILRSGPVAEAAIRQALSQVK